MDDTDKPQDGGERLITVNMLVGYNMARWRRASGMTQEQLGDELGNWTKAAVSAAERSWDGKKIRQFDADLIAELASIFGVPIPALFMPPPDDGETVRYLIDGQDAVPMSDLFAYLWPDSDWATGSPAAAEYQQAVISAMAKYAGGEAAKDLAGGMAELAAEEEIEIALREARANREAIGGLHALADRLAEENRMHQEALERALAGKRAQR